jgi:hypothetical protein
MKASYVMGLDVGPAGEPTGFAIVERPAMETRPNEYHYHLRHIERFPTGMAYTAIIGAVAERVTAGVKSSPIAVDLTAVGRQFLEQCWRSRQGLNVHAFAVTAGLSVQKAENHITLVPKRDLVMSLQLVLQGRRLKIAPELPQASLLTTELSNFRMKSVPINDQAAVEWRQGRHDDLVFAVALAVWFAEKHPPLWPDSIRGGGGLKFPKGVFLTDDDDDDDEDLSFGGRLARGLAW